MEIKKEILNNIKKLNTNNKIEFNKDYIFTKINEADFTLIEKKLNINIPNDYKWFLSKINGLNIEGFAINGIVTYNFNPNIKSYDVIEETTIFQKGNADLKTDIDIAPFISLNTEDSDYLILYNTTTNNVGIFSSIPKFNQIENDKPFLEFINLILQDYLED